MIMDNFLIAMMLSIFMVPAASFAEKPAIQDPGALNEDEIIYLQQNWDDNDRQFFYFTDQGSRFMPYDFFINLEQSDNQKLFKVPENLLRYGYVPVPASKENPDGLPIGFTRSEGQLGFTCAACHTQLIKYNNKFIRIDGGQAMADFPTFRLDLVKAIETTLNDEDKFSRFTINLLGNDSSDEERNELKDSLQLVLAKQKDYNRRNHSKVEYGYSRLDAFGAILNKGLNLTGIKDNFNPPDAPTSYPYIWDTPQHDYVEWNGSQSNSSIGALARNVGEVIGVFGEVDINPKKWLFFIDGGYASSIQASNLRKLEKVVTKLQSPQWPDFFPSIDKNLAQSGRPLYEKYCLGCHADIDRTDPARKIQVKMSTLDAIGTDPIMARNALEHRGKTGIFNGQPRFYKVGEVMGEEAPALFVVNNVMVGVLKNNPLQALLAKRDAKKLGHADVIHQPKYVDGKIIEHGKEVSEYALLAYKARPLNGIWTGGPYLHNGSVPNLYQLMLPAEKRDKTFYIGSWEFDPVNVGYVSTETPGSFLFDTSLKGNGNGGHEYGTGTDGLPVLSDDEIWALIEYMKTL